MGKGKNNKIILGVALILLGLLLVFAKPPDIPEPENSYTFAKEPVQVEGFESGEVSPEDLPKKIIIPSIDVDIPVKEARIINGYWEVFNDKAGWGEGSGLPGKGGNTVIFAHAREGLFLPLKDIEEGQEVYVLTDSNWYTYEVSEITEVYPTNTEVIKPTDEEVLTLYTCSGYNDSKRLIVKAERVIDVP